MTIFYLVRHGTRVDRSEETELSENECSITEIHKNNDGYVLHRVNDTSHLE